MKRLTSSFGFAWNGLNKCFKQEPNFKIHVAAALSAIAAGIFLKISSKEWIVTIICTGCVLAAELINTAIEGLCDIIYKEQHPSIKLIKDMAAAAVLVTAVAAALCGAFIFIPKIILVVN